MLFGDDEFRFLPISYDDIFCVAGPTPIADAHRSVFGQDQSTEPYEDAEAHNHARVIMAVHDAVRMLGHDNPVSLLRSEERRVGNEGVSTCRSRWSRYH